jgi:hypothetical protein
LSVQNPRKTGPEIVSKEAFMVATGKGVAPWRTTPWKLETSEETSAGLLIFTGGAGKLYFVDDHTPQQKLVVKYKYGSLGTSKGASFNYAESLTTDPSGGFNNVKVAPGTNSVAGRFRVGGGC